MSDDPAPHGNAGSQPPAEDGGDPTVRAVADASLRLMAGAVPKGRMDQLKRTVEQSPSEFPWQVVTQAILAEQVDEHRLVQQGLAAQRDWILRGGRTAKGPTVTRRAKGFVARLCAQLIFGVIFTVVIVAALILVRTKVEWFDIYGIVPWFRDLFGI